MAYSTKFPTQNSALVHTPQNFEKFEGFDSWTTTTHRGGSQQPLCGGRNHHNPPFQPHSGGRGPHS